MLLLRFAALLLAATTASLSLSAQAQIVHANFDTPTFDDGVSMGGPNLLFAIKTQAPTVLAATRVEVWTGEQSGTNTISLWSHDAINNRPLAPLGTGSWSMGRVNGWQGAPLATPVVLNANEDVWVVWGCQNGAQAPADGPGPGAQQYRGSFDGGASWNGPFTGQQWKFRIWTGFAGHYEVYGTGCNGSRGTPQLGWYGMPLARPLRPRPRHCRRCPARHCDRHQAAGPRDRAGQQRGAGPDQELPARAGPRVRSRGRRAGPLQSGRLRDRRQRPLLRGRDVPHQRWRLRHAQLHAVEGRGSRVPDGRGPHREVREVHPKRHPEVRAFPERIRMLVDTDRNGTLDRSTVFADQLHELADGIASGVLPVGNDVYFTNIPKLWQTARPTTTASRTKSRCCTTATACTRR
jgi:hypothetical protein